MTHVRIATADAAFLYRVFAAGAQHFAALEPAEDTDQLTLPLGYDQALDAAMEEREMFAQALEAFIDEREELKARIAELAQVAGDRLSIIRNMTSEREMVRQGIEEVGRYVAQGEQENAVLKREVRNVSDKVERQRGAINGKDREIALANEVLLQVARYHTTLKERLEHIGISFETNAEGSPEVSVDLPTFTGAFDRMFAG